MKLVTTSLAVSAIVLSFTGAGLAQTSVDTNTRGKAGVGATINTPAGGAKAGAGGETTTGSGIRNVTPPRGKTGAGGSASGSGQVGVPLDTTPKARGGASGGGSLGR